MDEQQAVEVAQKLEIVAEFVNQVFLQLFDENLYFTLVAYGTETRNFGGVVSNLTPSESLLRLEKFVEFSKMRAMQEAMAETEAELHAKH